MEDRKDELELYVKEISNNQKRQIHNKWIIGFLIISIIEILTFKLWGKEDSLVNLISIGSGLVSIALAFVAIFLALSESVKTSVKESKVDLALNKIIDNTEMMEKILNEKHSKLENKLDDLYSINESLINAYNDHGQKSKEQHNTSAVNKEDSKNSIGQKSYDQASPKTVEKQSHPKNGEIEDKRTFRGKVYLADLSPAEGAEIIGVRPVIVVSNEINNRFSPTVTIIPITVSLQKAKLPTHIELGLLLNTENASVALAEQVRTIDRKRLKELIGSLDEVTMKEVDQAIMIHMGIIEF